MITALVTLYHPDQRSAENVKRIGEQVDRVILCDNSPEENQALFDKTQNCAYIFNGKNLALSGAFNKVLKNPAFEWRPEEFLVFFDQDSVVPDEHIPTLLREWSEVAASVKVDTEIGALGPVFYNAQTGTTERTEPDRVLDEHRNQVSCLITSSMLTTYNVLQEIGFWNEDLFLDYADFDLCWRMQAKGYVCVQTDTTILQHALGQGEKKIGSLTFGITSQVREYYQIKAYLYLLEKDYLPREWRRIFKRNLTLRPLVRRFALDDGKERMKLVREAKRDFHAGYLGEYRENDGH